MYNDNDDDRVRFYLARAEELRTLRDTMRDAHSRRILHELAVNWDTMAKQIERIQNIRKRIGSK